MGTIAAVELALAISPTDAAKRYFRILLASASWMI